MIFPDRVNFENLFREMVIQTYGKFVAPSSPVEYEIRDRIEKATIDIIRRHNLTELLLVELDLIDWFKNYRDSR